MEWQRVLETEECAIFPGIVPTFHWIYKGNLSTRTGLLCNRFSNLLSETLDKGLDKPLGFQEFEDPRNSMKSARERGKFFILTLLQPLTPGDIPGTHFC